MILPWFVRTLPEPTEDTPEGEVARPSHTLGEALLTPGFWVFGLAVSFYGLLSSGLSLFNQAVLAERQFDRSVFLTLTAVGPVVGLGANLLTGLLARYGVRLGFLMAGALVLQGVALVLFPFVAELWQVYAYGVAMGVAGGALTVVFFGYWGQAYGPAHLGRIQGVAQMLTVFASAAGPLALAAGKQQLGSYSPVMQWMSVVSFVFAALAAVVPTPKPPPPEFPR